MSRLFCDGVTETVVPGQTRTSPPRDRRRTAVSAPAVIDEPDPMRLSATTNDPVPPVTGTIAGASSRRQRGRRGRSRRWLLAGVHIFGRLEADHQPIAGAVPRVAVRREQVEHDARDRRVLLVLIHANRKDVLLLDFNLLRDRAQTGVGQIDNKPRRRIQRTDLRNDGTAGEDLDRGHTAFVHDAHAPHQRRRTERLRGNCAGQQRRRQHHAHKFEHTSPQRSLAGSLMETYHLQGVGERERKRTVSGLRCWV